MYVPVIEFNVSMALLHLEYRKQDWGKVECEESNQVNTAQSLE